MSSMLRWIWDGIKQIAAALYGLAGNISSWIIGGLVAAANLLLNSVGDLFEAALPKIEWPEIFDGSGDLFSGIVHSLALDVAVESLGAVLVVWVACRVARLAMIPIRAMLEVL